MTEPSDGSEEYAEFDLRDDLADGDAIIAVPTESGPPLILIELDTEEHIGIALTADKAREFASRLFIIATEALSAPPAPPGTDPSLN